MLALTKTVMYFAIGVPFEAVWLKRFARTNPKMVIIHTEDGIEKIPLKGTHHHPEDEHLHEGIKDPHIWLSPLLVIIQVRNIYQALSQIDPSHAQQYRNNYEIFLRELEDLDQRIKQIFYDKKQGGRFLVYHPSWGYFAKAYGLVQLSIEVEGKEPSPRELKDLIEYAREHEVKAILVQPQFSMKSAQTVAKTIDAQVIIADPLDLNWADNLLRVAEKIRQALI
jgi:zinc transport system substrate-binding protein